MRIYKGLPVVGYRAQTTTAIDAVNEFKQMEERVLRMLEDAQKQGMCDPRWAAIGTTGLEQAFMAVNRSIFQPGRVSLPEDAGATP